MRHNAVFRISSRGFSSEPLSQFYMDKPSKLFTPGPLGVTDRVRRSLLVDFGSRDPTFLNFITESRRKVVEINKLDTSKFTAVYMQGPGTFGIEATLGSMLPRNAPHHLLILANGAYGLRQEQIAKVLGLKHSVLRYTDDQIPKTEEVQKFLRQNPDVTHVSMIYSETTSGIINPVEEIVSCVHSIGSGKKRGIFVDAMSSYGAYQLEMQKYGIDFAATSTNKCIQGVPGMAVVIANIESLKATEGNARSFSFDLYSQWKGLEDSKQFRFTAPTHVIRAFYEALKELEEEGGIDARKARYSKTQKLVSNEIKKLGFKLYVDEAIQGCIITTVMTPSNSEFDFKFLYNFLAERGKLIYPGKLTKADSFRIGSIGDLNHEDAQELIEDIKEALKAMKLKGPITYA